MNIRLKFNLAIILIGTGSIIGIGWLNYSLSRKTLLEESYHKLNTARETKKRAIEDYFQNIRRQILTMAENPFVIQSMKDFRAAFHGLRGPAQITRLKAYYSSTFLPKLPKETADASLLNIGRMAQILQYRYIVDNPRPPGKKDELTGSGRRDVYDRVHSGRHFTFRSYLKRFGYYDIFLVDPDGNIVYSVFKETDFGTNLLTGPYKKNNIARAFRAARDSSRSDFARLADFEPYPPSYNAPASFMATPIREGKKLLGILIFQIPIDKINNVMTGNRNWKKEGLGKTGETYIVGGDFTMRNDSRFLIEDKEHYLRQIQEKNIKPEIRDKIRLRKTSILLQEVKTSASGAALAGITGVDIIKDYRGVFVLSAYAPLRIPDVRWAILAEIDADETFAQAERLKYIFSGIIIVFILSTIMIGTIAGNRLIRPLETLTRQSKLLGEGGLELSEFSKRRDEFYSLAKALLEADQRIKEQKKAILLSREKAEQASAAKSHFLSRMSHELRTPLNHIIGFAQLLNMTLEGKAEGSDMENIAQIESSGSDLLRMIESILHFVSLEDGSFELGLESASPLSQVEECLQLMEPMARSRGMNFHLDRESFGDQTVLFDPRYFKQALIALIDNAVKYGNPNGKVNVALIQEKGDRIHINVSDEGPGLSPEQLRQAFLPFERLNEDTNIGGSGIGLTLARRLAELMGGNLSGRSEPGQGCVFSLILRPGKEKKEDKENYRILHVEDDPNMQLMVQLSLESDGEFTTRYSSGGREGLEACRTFRPDLILLDYNMPDINGEEFLRRLQKDASAPRVPVIFLSATSDVLQKESLIELGAIDFIQKPFDPIQLAADIKRILKDISCVRNIREG